MLHTYQNSDYNHASNTDVLGRQRKAKGSYRSSDPIVKYTYECTHSRCFLQIFDILCIVLIQGSIYSHHYIYQHRCFGHRLYLTKVCISGIFYCYFPKFRCLLGTFQHSRRFQNLAMLGSLCRLFRLFQPYADSYYILKGIDYLLFRATLDISHS